MNDDARRSQGGVIFLTVFIDLVGFSIIFPLFPDMLEYYLREEGAGGLFGTLYETLRKLAGGEGATAQFRTEVLFGGFLGSLYSVLQFACAPLWGRLSDRVGRKPVLLATIGGLALSYVGWFFSRSFTLLVVSRFFGGAMSGNIAVASAAIADSTEEQGRTRGMAIIGIAFGLGFIVGPAIGGLSSYYLDLTGPLSAVPGIHPFSAPALIAFLIAALNLVQVSGRFRETLEAPGVRTARPRRPVNPLRLFGRFPDVPGVDRAHAAWFVFSVLFAGMEFTLTFLAKDRYAFGVREMAGMFVYIGLLIALVQGGVVRRMAPRLGEKRLGATGLALLPVGFLLIGLPASLVLFFAGLALLAVGSACITPSMSGLVSLYSPVDRQGEVQGVFRSLGALARAVGPIAACAVYWELGAGPLYTVAAVALLIPLGLTLALPPPRPAAAPTPHGTPAPEAGETG